MKTYDPSDYRHILKGAELFINKGIELTKDIPLNDKYDFADQLLYQIGDAAINNDIETLNGLINFAKEISTELTTANN